MGWFSQLGGQLKVAKTVWSGIKEETATTMAHKMTYTYLHIRGTYPSLFRDRETQIAVSLAKVLRDHLCDGKMKVGYCSFLAKQVPTMADSDKGECALVENYVVVAMLYRLCLRMFTGTYSDISSKDYVLGGNLISTHRAAIGQTVRATIESYARGERRSKDDDEIAAFVAVISGDQEMVASMRSAYDVARTDGLMGGDAATTDKAIEDLQSTFGRCPQRMADPTHP